MGFFLSFSMTKIFSAKDFRLSEEQSQQLYEIVVAAYANTEKEIWGEGYIRMSKEDFQKYVELDEILMALLDGEIVGGIRYFPLKEGTWSFSLLGAAVDQTGKGIGRALIDAVEEKVAKKGADRIHIEVLRAEALDVESKTILSNWYQRLGYELTKTIDVFEVYNDPIKWSKLVNPAVFDCYLKHL